MIIKGYKYRNNNNNSNRIQINSNKTKIDSNNKAIILTKLINKNKYNRVDSLSNINIIINLNLSHHLISLNNKQI